MRTSASRGRDACHGRLGDQRSSVAAKDDDYLVTRRTRLTRSTSTSKAISYAVMVENTTNETLKVRRTTLTMVITTIWMQGGIHIRTTIWIDIMMMSHFCIRLFTFIDGTMGVHVFRGERMYIVIDPTEFGRRRRHIDSLDTFRGRA